MSSSATREPTPPSLSSVREHALGIISGAAVLALLYVGRDVFVPITLAVMLSLLIAPLVRLLRRLGLGQTPSVLAAVVGLSVVVGAFAAAIGMQLVRMTDRLPQYESRISHKLTTLNALTLGKLEALDGTAQRLLGVQPSAAASATEPSTQTPNASVVQTAAVRPAAQTSALSVLERVLWSVWVPLESAGIVLVVLVFLLLEHEAVRDRFIRVAGGTDIRATTLALNDAGERLSRFFVSQFRVNLGVACAVWVGLAVVGLPHALVWGAVTGVLRFVPYIGVWIAAAFATVLAAAVNPGWMLVLETLGLFVVVELIAGQLIEPRLYGHATGLSPLSVVVAAIFWSWLWGPTGLIVSTPLTLCLVVAGRHIRALSVLDVLLGDTQALTLPQRFYQRALSADAQENIAGAKVFLRRNAFAAYCDAVLMPAFALARADLDAGAITAEQQGRVRDVMVAVIAAIGGERRRLTRQQRESVLDASNAGRRLRQQREAVAGRFQGPMSVPLGSVMLCVGLGSSSDDLATELLVRILREQRVDARHASIEELRGPSPPGSRPGTVSVVFLISALPGKDREQGEPMAAEIRKRFPGVCLVTVFLPGVLLQPDPIDRVHSADRAAISFGHAVQICLDLQQDQLRHDQPGGAR